MFADDAGKKGGEFYTSKGVVQLIVRLIKPETGNKVYDPACGSGGMLIESAHYIDEHFRKKAGHINVSLFGPEKNFSTWAICKLNMIFHNLTDADILKGDTLDNPKHLVNNELKTFDRVIAPPPFSQVKWWDRAEVEVKKCKTCKEVSLNYSKVVNDPFGRFKYGIPPRSYADLAFLQHMIAVLNRPGRLSIVLPHSVLFRGGAEGDCPGEGFLLNKFLMKILIDGSLPETKSSMSPYTIKEMAKVIIPNTKFSQRGKIIRRRMIEKAVML